MIENIFSLFNNPTVLNISLILTSGISLLYLSRWLHCNPSNKSRNKLHHQLLCFVVNLLKLITFPTGLFLIVFVLVSHIQHNSLFSPTHQATTIEKLPIIAATKETPSTNKITSHSETKPTTKDKSINSEVIFTMIALVISILMSGILTIAKNAINDLKEEKKRINDAYSNFVDDVNKEIASLKREEIKGDLVDYRYSIASNNNEEIQQYELNSENNSSNNISSEDKENYLFRLLLEKHYKSPDLEGYEGYLEFMKNYKNKNKNKNIKLTDNEYKYLELLYDYYLNHYQPVDELGKPEDDKKIKFKKLVKAVKKNWRF